MSNRSNESLRQITDMKYFIHGDSMNTPTSDYYVNYFFNNAKHGEKYYWNWWPFLFGPFWFVLRKMYAFGLLFFLIQVTCLVIFNKLTSLYSTGIIQLIEYLFLAIIGIVTGNIANYLYFLKFKKNYDKAPEIRNKRNDYFSKKGGLSISSCGFLLLLLIAYYLYQNNFF